MKIKLPKEVKIIISELIENGFEAYAVGGCVRDSILGRIPEDWDITTSAKPEQVKELFSKTIDTGIEHGTVTVMIEREGFEVTTYRVDGEYEDGRHPKEVTFTRNLEEDLKRRDFTINAMAYNEEQGIIDIFQGVEDLEKGIIRCVGDPRERFNEDALRMLRAVRFAAQLGFEIDENTKQAIQSLAGTLEKISAERIQVEIVKLMISKHPEYIRIAYETGITKIVLPEFDKMMETSQNNPHHSYNVGEHTLQCLLYTESDKVLRLATLLHDIGKPDCRIVDEKGIDHFYHHQKTGADLTQKVLRRLRFDNDTLHKVKKLVYWHDYRPSLSKKGIRKALYRVSEELFPYLLKIRYADLMGQSEYQRESKIADLEEMKILHTQIIEDKECFTLKHLGVSGKDLIDLGMKPGKKIGEILSELLMIVIEDPKLNRRELLLEYVREKYF